MRRILLATVLAGTAAFGFGGSANAVCGGTLLCAGQNACYGLVNACPNANYCSGGVNACPGAWTCSGLVNVCDLRVPATQ